MLVRRLASAAQQDHHGLTLRVLMDAGELGSRNLSATWIEVPPDTEETLHSHEDSEQLYVVVRGPGTMRVAGDEGELEQGDVVLVPPATDHTLANRGQGLFAVVSIQSPPVAVDELFGRELAGDLVGEYEDLD